MSALMTAVEVRDTAFSRKVETDKIKESLIEGVQGKHFIPVLGEDLYDAILADTASYAALIAKIKPALAYMVKYYLLPEVYSEISTTGLGMITGKNNQKASREELIDQQKAALDAYSLQANLLTKFLNDNEEDYPLYYSGSNPENTIIEAGGIIFPSRSTDDFYCDDDDYTMHVKRY